MPWLKISVEAAGASAEALSERMLACGALSVSFGASGVIGDEVLEPPPGAVPLWPRVTLSGLFPPAVDAQALNSALGAIGASDIDWLGDQDWAAPRSGDVPELRFGDRLAVVPRDGEHIPTAQSRAKGFPGAVLRLDPGLAFGTGQHPTTRSCLAWLADARLEGRSVLDYGCGSGILGIAAALLGAARVVAVDIEPQALSATRANAVFNDVALDAVTKPDGFLPQPGFDVVLANILANTLIELGPALSGCLNAGGRLVLAGLLEPQIDAVTAAYPSLAFDPPSIDGEWACLTGRRRD
ncbi:MAG: methyltransferase [Gammaproteobacteria bacterium]|nr:methyltransferase [Gammaproteobacteria bacterium]